MAKNNFFVYCNSLVGWHGFIVRPAATRKKIPLDEEINWIDIDLADEEIFAEGSAPETSDDGITPGFEFSKLMMPEIKIPELIFEEPKITPPELIIKPVEIPKQPEIPPPPPAPENKVQPPPETEKVPEKTLPQKLKRQPATVKEYYPPKGSGLGYKGMIIIAVKIDKDGKVQGADIVQGSGIIAVDTLAEEYVRKWIFRPAMDENGKVMESVKVISLDFKKFE